jgi:hypothetical protein
MGSIPSYTDPSKNKHEANDQYHRPNDHILNVRTCTPSQKPFVCYRTITLSRVRSKQDPNGLRVVWITCNQGLSQNTRTFIITPTEANFGFR